MYELREQHYPYGDPCDPFADEPYTLYIVCEKTQHGTQDVYSTKDKVRAKEALKIFREADDEKK